MQIAEQILTDVGGPPMVQWWVLITAAELHQLIIIITMVMVIILTNLNTGFFSHLNYGKPRLGESTLT